MQNSNESNNNSSRPGKLYVVGLGPGSYGDMSHRAETALQESNIIVGYNTYIKLIEKLIVGKEVVGTAMMQEIERCKRAVELAAQGNQVAVVSSGDSGIYGMAGLVIELVHKLPAEQRPQLEVVPGISAVSAAASVLGAPLMHDFAVISLSDLLTPWEKIQKRIVMAAEGDFVTALYNPKSTRRTSQIEFVRETMLKCRAAKTPVGIVTNATREGEICVISDLENFTNEEIAMFSLVIIGNSQTYVENGRMITPRGYHV